MFSQNKDVYPAVAGFRFYLRQFCDEFYLAKLLADFFICERLLLFYNVYQHAVIIQPVKIRGAVHSHINSEIEGICTLR